MTTVKTEVKVQPRIYGKIVLSLENSILDLEKKPTPSELDGLDVDTETDLRILGCELIQTAGILLRIPQVSTVLWKSCNLLNFELAFAKKLK